MAYHQYLCEQEGGEKKDAYRVEQHVSERKIMMIQLTPEESRRLRYELKHPNREAMARRDAWFASFEGEVHISPDWSTISIKIPI